MINKKIIEEADITLRGLDYKKITYEDGEKILKRFDNESKMWVILRFKNVDDTDKLKRIKETSKQILVNTSKLLDNHNYS